MNATAAITARPPRTAIVRFESKLIHSPNGCWEYQGSLSTNGYGIFWFEGANVYAHRFAFEEYNGPIPDRMLVCHKCDNRRCCNPDHLFVGDYSDNANDMIAKGRGPKNRGEDNNYVAITQVIAQSIKDQLKTGKSKKLIANDLGVKYHHVTNIAYGNAWSWL